jgi:amidophosphoribosyltransferase
MFDKLREHCGIFGVFGHSEAANLTYLGLHALQHRGQESAGIVVSDGQEVREHRAMGLVADVFGEKIVRELKGSSAIGHVRYSTAGDSDPANAQPFTARWSGGVLAIAHNGNLVNADALRAELMEMGALFQSTSDTEAILHLVARSRGADLAARIGEGLKRVQGAYSLLFLTERAIVGVRDPWGLRPLVLGRLKGAYVLASETCALDLIEAEFLREVEPGEVIVIDADGLHSTRPLPPAPTARCVFELIYFSRPDSMMFGRSVHEVRKEFGRQLALEHPADVDLVIPVPDSGTPAALGFSQQSKVPFDFGLIRSHYVGRTFIEPQQSIRHFGVKLKLSAVAPLLRGKRIAVVDDSIVRGTTSRKIVTILRAAGAREVHVRISSPPTAWPCYYGIDTPRREELIAASHSRDEIAKYLAADSLGYLSLKGVAAAVGDFSSWCDACFSGRYPIDFSAGKAAAEPKPK